MTTETVFKIRNRTTNLFSTGGSSPTWNDIGKQWSSKGALNNHLNLIEGNEYRNCEIVLFELKEVTSEFTNQDLDVYIADRRRARQLKKEAYDIVVKEEHRLREIKKAMQVLEDNGIEIK